MRTKSRLKRLAARVAEAVARATGDDDSELAQIAYRRAARWAGSPDGTAYDNRPIREVAEEARVAGL